MKQGLEIVIEAAEQLKNEPDYQFVIVGTGGNAENLKAAVTAAKLDNIHFKPTQPWELMPAVLAMADLHLVVQKRGIADFVLPSKVSNILSAGGNALVTADLDTELGLLAEEVPGIYTRIDPEDSEVLLIALKRVLASDLPKPNEVARHYALTHLSKDKVIADFNQSLIQLVSGSA